VSQEIDSASKDVVPQIELRIPGPWRSPTELGVAIRRSDSGYELQYDKERETGMLVHVASGQRFTIEAGDADDEIAGIFAETGRLSREEIDAIAAHQVKVFVTGPGGSLDAARAMLAAGAAMLKAGGTGVMVDNCGAAHSPKDWMALAGDKQMGGMYWAFVVVTGGDDEVFSTGMHCLGFRDAELPNPPSRDEGGFILHNFLGYCYQSGATILDGEAIGGPEGAEFRLRHVPDTRFPAGARFHNPYGLWRLEPIDEDDGETDAL
jgi:hypothetical protein